MKLKAVYYTKYVEVFMVGEYGDTGTPFEKKIFEGTKINGDTLKALGKIFNFEVEEISAHAERKIRGFTPEVSV